MLALTILDINANGQTKNFTNALLRLVFVEKLGFRIGINLMQLVYVRCKARI